VVAKIVVKAGVSYLNAFITVTADEALAEAREAEAEVQRGSSVKGHHPRLERCIGCRHSEENPLLIPRDNRVDRRVLPGAQTIEAKCVPVVGQSRRQIGREELGRDLADYGVLPRAAALSS
jgi:hypothetical protein